MRALVVCLMTFLIGATGCASHSGQAGSDPLPAWNDTPHKQSITDFVKRVTTADTPDFVAAEDRVAVFDNDGTLWPEAPVPFQLQFVLDELKRRTPDDPKLAADPMVQAALRGDLPALLAGDRHDGLLHVLALHDGDHVLGGLHVDLADHFPGRRVEGHALIRCQAQCARRRH